MGKLEPGNDSNQCEVAFTNKQTATQAFTFFNNRRFYDKTVTASFKPSEESKQQRNMSGESHAIYVGDLCDTVDDNQLKKLFSSCGTVVNVKVVRDLATFQSKGFGFVSFTSKEDAEHAIESMAGQQLGKKTIKTNWASRNKGQAQMQNKLNYDEVYAGSDESNCTVYIGNLPNGVSPDLVKEKFTEFGPIVDSRIMIDKGYAFIKYNSHKTAAQAITQNNGLELHGAFLKVWWGKPQDSNQQQNFQGGMSMGAGNMGAGNMMMGQQDIPIPGTPEEMYRNLEPMFDANNIQKEQREQLIQYMMSQPNGEYYIQCMRTWKTYEAQRYQQQLAMNTMQYAGMYNNAQIPMQPGAVGMMQPQQNYGVPGQQQQYMPQQAPGQAGYI